MNNFNYNQEPIYDNSTSFSPQNDILNNFQTEPLNNNLYNNQEGYIKGNLFSKLYSQYKNYQPAMLKAQNDQERLFLNLSAFDFAAHELNLYLDNFPNDRNIIQLFNNYRQLALKTEHDYETKYGPLNMTSETLNTTPWAWTQTKFPWDEGGM